LADALRNRQAFVCIEEPSYQPFSLIDPSIPTSLNADDFDDIYPVSYTQLGMISENLKYEHVMHTDNFHFTVLHPYSASRLTQCLSQLLQRHSLLRSIIVEHAQHDFVIAQKKHDSPQNHLTTHRLNHQDYQDFDSEVFAQQAFIHDSNLNDMARTLFQLHVFIDRTDNANFKLIGLFNHVIADGWSLNLFSSQLLNMYLYPDKSNDDSDDENMHYAQFIAHEQYCVAKRHSQAFWLTHLAGYEHKPDLKLHNTVATPSLTEPPGLTQVSPQLIERAHPLCEKLNINIDLIFMAATYALLSQFYSSTDLTLGYVQNNRPETTGAENAFGYFLNIVPMRMTINSRDPLQLLLDVNQTRTQILQHKLFPYPLIHKAVGASEILFNMAFNYINFKGIDQFAGQDIDSYTNSGLAQIPSYVEVRNIKGRFYVQLNVNTDNIDPYFQHYLTQYYFLYLESIITEKTLPHVIPEEYRQIQAIPKPIENAQTRASHICTLFETQVEHAPDNIALYHEGKTLTYQQLNMHANQLAHVIRQQYAQQAGHELSSGCLIAICIDKSLEVIVAILAVLKAGAAYVPISPYYPKRRIEYILHDTQTALVLTSKALLEDHANDGFLQDKAFCVDLRNLSSELMSANTDNVNIARDPQDLAYVIYTSGTSGQPKGTLLSHRALINFVSSQKNDIDIHCDSRILQYAAMVFDASIWATFSALCYGAQLYLAPASVRQEPQQLIDFLTAHRINIALLPPALINAIDYQKISHLHTLLVGGDLCSADKMHSWSQDRKLLNCYGPTESTVYATTHHFRSGDSHINIGKPIHNMKAYVLDNAQQPVPIGVEGQLYLSGKSLAEGYLNQPALSAEKFVANPFIHRHDPQRPDYAKMYHTGDLVKWLPNGELQFQGRMDDQVKIRGYRIEIGEIEKQLQGILAIKQACVMLKTRADKSRHLVGYYSTATKACINHDSIIALLSEQLPHYMLPSMMIHVDAFPMTLSGKIDKRSLPEPDLSLNDSYQPASTPAEQALCAIWQEVLELNKVGIDDDFFKIGGESISAIRVSHRMSRQLGTPVSVAKIFRYRTIRSLLKNISLEDESTSYGEL